jgi:hypothetical protein
LLRLPCTLNRKDQRNGKEPVPCELVECDPTRRYAFADFEWFAETSPARVRRERVAAIRLKVPRKVTATKQDRLDALINACAVAEDRSRADWALVCWAVENAVDREHLWSQVQGVGKFAQRGREYFDLILEKAEGHTREQIYLKLERKDAGATPAGNGHAHADGSAAGAAPPTEPPDGQDRATARTTKARGRCLASARSRGTSGSCATSPPMP